MMKGNGCMVHKLTWALVIIGALNWGLMGFFNFNLVTWLLGSWPMVERVVYALVGLSAVALLVGCKCKQCAAACGNMEKKM